MKLFILLVLCFASISTFGATRTWDGGGADANWTTAANWVGDVAPSPNDDLIFPAAAKQFVTNNNFFILTTFRSITFEGGTYTIGGNLFRLTHGIAANAGTQTMNTAITLSAAQTISAGQGATLTLLGLSIGSFATTLTGDGIIGIGLISGSGPVTKSGLGAAAIITASSFSSPLTLLNGILVVDANIPSSTVTINSTDPTGGFALSGFGGTGTVGATNVLQGIISAGTFTSPTGILNLANGLTLTENGAFVCKISGTTPGSAGHDQLNVTGQVVLGNSVLAPIPLNNFTPAIGDEFLVIRNDGSDPVNGTFLNLPEGGVFAGPLNTAFKISYVAGDGNDISIRRVPRAAFDFDGDGRTDIGVNSGSIWSIVRSNDGVVQDTPFGVGTDLLTPADFDGDNRTDIAVFRPSDGVWYVLNSATSTVSIDQFGSNGDIPVPNDFDGDGRADRSVFRPSDGVWYQLRSLGQQPFAVQFGMAGDKPLMMDYDGDGLADPVVFRPSNGTWHFLRSSDSSYVAFPFGVDGDIPVPADYNGDGLTDVAIFRATDDSNLPDFYILLSGSNQYYGISWGVAGDLPVVGDYDGDGRADIAIFRPSSNEWYVLGSTAGFEYRNFGSTGSVPIPGAFNR